MAKRFRGPFSPDTPPQITPPTGDPSRALPARHGPQPPAPHPLARRTRWLPIAAIPMLLTAFGQGPLGLVADLAGFGLVLGAGFLTREGLRAEMAYRARRVARRPALPRKLLGGAAMGLGLALGAAHGGLGGALVIGLAGWALHFLAFGADPMHDKGMEGIDRAQQDRVARAIDEGEAYLAQMRDAILRTGNDRLIARVDMFAATARDLFRRLEETPGDLAGARRYLGVYLMGARDATARFADHFAATRDESARQDYEALLGDLEQNFAGQTSLMIEDGRSDMTIEIEVLRERLAREGLRAH